MVALSSSMGAARTRNRWGSSVVEHVLGKDEVAGSNPVPSSMERRNAFVNAGKIEN
jgi:hypothetical protein